MIAEKIRYLKQCMEDIVINNPKVIPFYIGENMEGYDFFMITNLTKNQ